MSETDCQVALVHTTCFHQEMVGLVVGGGLVAYNSLKTITTDELYQHIDYYCIAIYTQSSNWPAAIPHHLFTFGSEKIGPCT